MGDVEGFCYLVILICIVLVAMNFSDDLKASQYCTLKSHYDVGRCDFLTRNCYCTQNFDEGWENQNGTLVEVHNIYERFTLDGEKYVDKTK